MGWVRVCSTEDLQDGRMRAVEVDERRIALFRVDGRVYASDNVCTHAFTLLTDGWLDDHCVECPLHGAQFDIRNGAVISGPATVPLDTFPARISGQDIEILAD